MTAKAKNKHAKGDETDETFQWGIRHVGAAGDKCS